MCSKLVVFSVVLFSTTIYGCVAPATQYEPSRQLGNSIEGISASQSASASRCIYDQLDGDEYRLTDAFSPYASNMFFFNPNRDGGLAQLNKSAYEPLANSPFKVVEAGVLTASAQTARKPYLAEYRYSEVKLDGELFKIDKGHSTKIMTQDCSVYYYKVGETPKMLDGSVVQLDGSPLTTQQFVRLNGSMAIIPINTKANVEFDRFTQDYKITTPYFDDMLLRAVVEGATGNLEMAQLYSDLVFFEDWGNVERAIDTNSSVYPITKIDTDIDCSNSNLTGCRLTETIGVTFDESYLESNINGFELRYQGTKKREVEVPGTLVKSLLIGIAEARRESAKIQ